MPAAIDKLWFLTVTLARAAARAGGAMLVLAALIVSAEVLLRKAFTLMFTGSDEIAACLFAVGTAWSMAHVLVCRGHVRIDALYVRLGPRARVALDLIALAMLATFVAALSYQAFVVAHTSFVDSARSNTPLRVPLALPQIAWCAGIVFFLFTVVLNGVRALLALTRGDIAGAQAISGVLGQSEEIEDEIRSLGLRTNRERAP